jgi:hypothetical protein
MHRIQVYSEGFEWILKAGLGWLQFNKQNQIHIGLTEFLGIHNTTRTTGFNLTYYGTGRRP